VVGQEIDDVGAAEERAFGEVEMGEFGGAGDGVQGAGG